MTVNELDEILRLTLSHAFYGDSHIPLRLRPANHAAARRHNVKFANQPDGISVLISGDRPDKISLALEAEDPLVFSVTAGGPFDRTPVFDLPYSPADGEFRIGDASPVGFDKSRGRLAVLNIGLAGSGARQLTVAFKAVATYWTFHISGFGGAGQLIVEDVAEEFTCKALGERTFPDGRKARSFRSTRPLPLSARPQTRFRLIEESPAGSRVLVPVLPTAGTEIGMIEGSDDLVSDIYVQL